MTGIDMQLQPKRDIELRKRCGATGMLNALR